MTEQTTTKEKNPFEYYTPILYNEFVKKVPKNFRNVTFCSHVKSPTKEYLRVIQSGEEFKFDYIDIQPHKRIEDLKTLEDRLFLTLKD